MYTYTYTYLPKLITITTHITIYAHTYTNLYTHVYTCIQLSLLPYMVVYMIHTNPAFKTTAYMALMSHRSRSHVKSSMVLTRADHLCIHNYIRSLLNGILIPILMVRTRLVLAFYCLCV